MTIRDLAPTHAHYPPLSYYHAVLSTPIEIAHFRRLKLHTGRAASPIVRSGLLPAGPAGAGSGGFGLGGQAPDEVPVLAHAVAIPPTVQRCGIRRHSSRRDRPGHGVVGQFEL
jgi:hypothetical protein